jgi:hypothetical protein
MECSICLSDITAATGVYTTSCRHSFHFRCAVTWFVNSEVENCPMCRHEMGENEKLPEEAEEEEEEEDEDEDEDEEEEEEDSIPEFNEEEHALWVFRKTFQMLDNNDSIMATERAYIPQQEDVRWRSRRTDIKHLRWRTMRTDGRFIDDGYDTA